MAKQIFGGTWTDQKIETVRKYLVQYLKILHGVKGSFYTTIYVDAFAGTGRRDQMHNIKDQFSLFNNAEEGESDAYLKGSAQVALELEPGLDKYLLIESDSGKVNQLERLRDRFPQKNDKIEIVCGDANKQLVD